MAELHETPWQAGRLDGAVGPKAVLFGRTYEDPRVELGVFEGCNRVLCIASAGCTPRALAARHEVVAVDINPVQLDYARYRLGGGAPQLGRAERVMAAARTLLPLTGVTRAALTAFLSLTDTAEQLEAWEQLCTRRFTLGMDALFSFGGLRSVYASPLLQVLPAHFGRVLRARFTRTFGTHPNADNPYARALFLGELSDELEPVQGSVELVCADAASYLESQPAGSFDGASLSNILDGASDAYRERLMRAARHAVRPEGRVLLRSFGEPQRPEDGTRAGDDRSMLWGSLAVCSAGELR